MSKKWTILKIIILASLITFILIGAEFFLFYNYFSKTLISRESIKEIYSSTVETQALHAKIQDMELAQRGFIITGNDKFIQTYFKVLGINKLGEDSPVINNRLNKLFELSKNNSIVTQQLTELKQLIDKKLLYLNETIELRKNHATHTLISRIDGVEGKPLLDQIRNKFSDILITQQNILNSQNNEDSSLEKKVLHIIEFLFLLNYLIISLQIFLVVRGYININKAHEAQHESDKKFQSLFENYPDACTILNKDHQILYCNHAATRLFGCTKEQLLGTPINKFWPSQQPDNVESTEKFKGIIKKVKNEHDQRFEWILKNSTGDLFPVEVMINIVQFNEETILLTSWHNITELKKVEQALRDNEIQLNLAVSGTSDGLWDWNMLTNHVYYSPRFLEIIGYNADELPSVLQTFTELLHPDDTARAYAAVDQHLYEKLPYNIEYRLQHKAGHYIWCNAKGQAIWNEAGIATRMAGFITDVTQQKEIARMRNEFISTVSHELRTPLTSINGSLTLLHCGMVDELPEKANTLIDLAYRNSKRLLCLINDILDIEKLDMGLMRFTPQNQSVQSSMQHAKEMNAAYGLKHNINIAVSNLDPDAYIHVDSARLMQIITNFLANAIKFSPAGSTVTISATYNQDKIKIAVSDQGTGISHEFKPHIFNIFSQAESVVRSQKGGTGLGLYISKKITEHMGGTIGFESTPGAGAEFWVEFPVVRSYSN